MAVLSGGTGALQPSRDWSSSGCLVGRACGRVLRGGAQCAARHGLQSPPPEPEVKGVTPAKVAGTELTCSSVSYFAFLMVYSFYVYTVINYIMFCCNHCCKYQKNTELFFAAWIAT